MFVNRVSGFTAHDELATVFSFRFLPFFLSTFVGSVCAVGMADAVCVCVCAKTAKFHARQSENVKTMNTRAAH